MSLSGALSNALSGLTAASRSAQVTASNLSNALTPGFGRREVALGARDLGYHGGVQVLGITRHANPGLVGEHRLAAAAQGESSELADFHARLETLVGRPDNPASLSARLAEFEASVVSAASRPDLNARLDQVLSNAKSLAIGFEAVSDGIQALRSEADRLIASTVDHLNTALGQIRELNLRISAAVVNGRAAVGPVRDPRRDRPRRSGET
ncbi:FlgK family flagellar hook-associated protein [Marimonas lutisalis]|uniref:FlgK family flagellar hook-associated protein n=1 Tax=Marimonas lutisalis TaxID=2545756 RepID=UPI001F232A65|nr:flagellar basal body protein [Marimonas lutisalis]